MAKRTCSSPDCQKPARTRGLCDAHYAVLLRSGQLPPRLTAEERFWSKVDKGAGCWLWRAGRNGDGYGNIKMDGRYHVAHRVAYEWLVGPVPAGLELDHLCRVRACVNPEHLEPVTHAENVRRGRSGWQHKLKSHCPQGHLYDGVNGRGARTCSVCHKATDREWQRAYRARVTGSDTGER